MFALPVAAATPAAAGYAEAISPVMRAASVFGLPSALKSLMSCSGSPKKPSLSVWMSCERSLVRTSGATVDFAPGTCSMEPALMKLSDCSPPTSGSSFVKVSGVSESHAG